MKHDLEDRIRARAYALWEKDGRPHGHDQAFWERAESMEQKAGEQKAGEQKAGEREPAPPPNAAPVQKRAKADAKIGAAVAKTSLADKRAGATGTKKATAPKSPSKAKAEPKSIQAAAPRKPK